MHHLPDYDNTENYPYYDGNDLGLTYTEQFSRFKIWSPVANQAEILLYYTGEHEYPFKIVPLQSDENGTWHTEIMGDWKGYFYTFKVNINHEWSHEVIDPYARACGVNGKKAAIINLKESNPQQWIYDSPLPFSANNLPTDAIIYELHIRDVSLDKQSGIIHKGKYIGLAETGTTNNEGATTGLSHIKELGVTHIHLLPFFDFFTVDEHPHHSHQYNWGYDPLNYNIPEGSYSTNPFDGIARIKELKMMIQSIHQNGMRVIMDVVYNHTGLTEKSNFNQLVPGYYYRHKTHGGFSDASSCGNETASERPMMRKFMIDSLTYWVNEYHIDGFRFDLMGVHDIETMNLISESLHTINPEILLYGEGWTAGHSPLPDERRALKDNTRFLHKIGAFNDEIRDAIKGSTFDKHDKGFISGNFHKTNSLKSGIVASCAHPQLNGHYSFATSPSQTITYCECHDNYTLWDKLQLSNPDTSMADLKKMHHLALTILLTSQGIPFLHAGTEFLRSKQMIENSYKSPDSINAIKWSQKNEHSDTVDLVKNLIQLRKEHPTFRMRSATQVAENILFDENSPEGIIAFTLNGEAVNDPWKKIWVAYNGNSEEINLALPMGKWQQAFPLAASHYMHNEQIVVPKYEAVIFFIS